MADQPAAAPATIADDSAVTAGGDADSTVARRRPGHVPSLLESLNSNHLDPGYAAAARRRGAAPGSAPEHGRAWTIAAVVAALLAVGVLFGVSAGNTESNAPRAEQARSGLLEDIDRAQQRQAVLATSAADLAARLRASQSELGAAGPLQTVAELEAAGQVTPVTGPGLRIVIDEAPEGANSSGGGVILDRDIQLLVNDLWAAGAEAISIGGVRLQPRSAIRQAGGSILVDNRPVFWPITIDAIGDRSNMQVKLISTAGYGRFSSFAQLYDIQFDVSTQDALTLPGGSGTDLLYARSPGTAAASSTDGSRPAGSARSSPRAAATTPRKTAAGGTPTG